MLDELNPKTDSNQVMVYQIRIKGHLGSRWTDRFGGLTITLVENGDTLLTGPVVDQAALHGVLIEKLFRHGANSLNIELFQK